VAFEVSIAPEVLDYLNACERLTEADIARILEGVYAELGEGADKFLAQNPHPYLPNRYWYDYTQMTEAHEVRTFVFACSADGHVYGITEVLYGEEHPEEDSEL
jgi:hypothetical protein